MGILIDRPLWWFRGRRWSHVVSDVSYDELHDWAGRMGIPRRAFQGDHYDLPEEYYDAALGHGAEPTDSRDLVRRLRSAGLRRRKRRDGDASGTDAHHDTGTSRTADPSPGTAVGPIDPGQPQVGGGSLM